MQQIKIGGIPSAANVGLTPRTTLAFAMAAGLSVANVYYAQPLLDTIAHDFGISSASVGLVVTLTQIGYALGLIFIVPLGDLMDRRRLILAQGALSVLALASVAAANSVAILFASLAAVGLLAVLVQVLVASAAAMAAPSERGRAVGMVTSGIVIGILAARFVAGVLADFGGWRTVYATSAALTLGVVIVLARVLPSQPAPVRTESYIATLRSIPVMFLHDKVLLLRGLLAFLIFAAFSTFWTGLTLPLTAAPFHYNHTQIGVFGLVGLVGAVAAAGAGKLADRGRAAHVTGFSLLLLFASWALIALLPTSLLALIVGVVMLDFAVQAVHVTSQTIIFERHPEARSRLVGGYMVFYSLGSAAGAIAATSVYAGSGWAGVSTMGAAFSLAALLVFLGTSRLSWRKN